MAARISEAQVRRTVDRLTVLQADPPAQARAALAALSLPPSPGILFSVASVLEKHPLVEAHDPLVAAYIAVEADRKKLDSGGALRAAILKALRRVAGPVDLPLVLRAAATYEVTPNGPAALELRAEAAITLVDLRPDTAALVAARLLAEAPDPAVTARQTGEPAVTAARVLGAIGRYEALYMAATLDWNAPSEVIAECIRQLAAAPQLVFPSLVQRFAACTDDAINAALVDLLVAGEERGQDAEADIVHWLRTVSLDVYQFAIASLVASRRPDLHAVAANLVGEEFRRDRLTVAAEALANARGSQPLLEARATVRDRLDS
ncbi:MAG: hypothetical protein AB7T37_08200 [Dehalococcoidia bacterium]